LDKIYKARNSTYHLEFIHSINSSIAQNITKIAVGQFMESTVGFESHSCLNSREELITGIYESTNCYHDISVAIHGKIDASFPRISVVLGEKSHYSNFNSAGNSYFSINLGPLYILIFKF